FSPMLFLSGIFGRFWSIIPLVVIACLAFSLVECLLVLPAHLSRGPDATLRRGRGPVRLIEGLQDLIAAGLRRFIDHVYEPTLRRALRWRYLTLGLFVGTVLLSVGLVAGGFIRFVGFPTITADFVRATVEMPNGTHRDVTWATMQRLADGIDSLRERYDGVDDGRPPVFGHLGMTLTAADRGILVIELLSTDERGVDAAVIKRQWLAEVGELPGVKSLDFRFQIGPGGGETIMQLSGTDLERLQAASGALQERLAAFDGLVNIRDTLSDGKEEMVLRIRPEAEVLGLRLADLARQVRHAFHGAEAQRIQRGRDEVRVMVRYPDEQRHSLATLDDMRIRAPDGTAVPFAAVAAVERAIGYPAIRREDRRRVVQITCDIDPATADSGAITDTLAEEVLPSIERDFPGILASFGGSTRDLGQLQRELGVGFLLAFLTMWGLMAVSFRSYLQPLLVLSAIPFGIIGAIAGHGLLGYQLNLLSLMGIIALAGVVVNDALVLIDAVNRERDEGRALVPALIAGGRRRFRAILLTTLTTFLGLMPLMLETSLQARFLIPMAISLAFGVVFATVITLVLVPTLYLMLDDLGRAWLRLLGRRSQATEG
ncbi:MAG: efflux RND transporter permease subunit, partial [Planctomycetota bacterium]